ncbi:MAG: DNA methyltransferase [Blastocatellia bacterium]|nr:DNA methyltransferase [Blastocatellia bacterium]
MLLDPEPSSSVPASIRLDRARLLDALTTARLNPSTATLRRSINDLRTGVRSSAGAYRVRGLREAAEFTPEFLDEEFDQICGAQTLDRARYYVDRLIKSITEVRTSAINDINLNRWKEYEDIQTDSLWLVANRERGGAHSAKYWGNFVPQIPHQMMRRYTKAGDWVLDVFAGSGTSLIEGQRLGRNTIGIELQPQVARMARKAIASEPNAFDVTSQVVCGDSASIDARKLLRAHGQETAQLVIMHPPYFDIIKFSEDERDLSNAPSVEAFLDTIGRVVDNVAPVLDRGRYLAVVIGDKYANGEWVPLGFRTMDAIQQRGFMLKSVIVKNFEQTTAKRQQKELWKYRALAGGFYVFKHEYIFVFKKVHK